MDDDPAARRDDDVDEADDDEEDARASAAKQKQIFLIDGGALMFEVQADGKTRLETVLQSIGVDMRKKIAEGRRDEVGVTLFGDALDRPRAVTLVPLGEACAEGAMLVHRGLREGWFRDAAKLTAVIDDGKALQSDDEADFAGSRVCVGDGGALRNGIWSCSNQFSLAKKTAGETDRTVFCMSAQEAPCATADQANVCIQLGRDCADSRIELQLWFFGDGFDLEPFWGKLLEANNFAEADDWKGRVHRGNFANTDAVRRKATKQRAVANLTITLPTAHDGAPVEPIRARRYDFVKKQKVPTTTVKTDYKTNEKVEMRMTKVNARSGATISTHDNVKVVNIRGTPVIFEDEDILAVRPLSAVEDDLKIIGFASAESVRHMLDTAPLAQPPSVIYPDEDASPGSTQAIAALVSEMRHAGLVALARYSRRVKSISVSGPRMVVVAPVGSEHAPLHGLYLYEMVALDNLKPAAPLEVLAPPAEAVESFRRIVQRLDCAELEREATPLNPQILHFYGIVESVKLDLGADELERTRKRANAQLAPPSEDAFAELRGDFAAIDAALPGDEGRPLKRVKAEMATLEASQIATYTSESLMVYNAAALKDLCKALEVAVSGTKAVLVDRILAKSAT
ncbi:SPOC like C-terminal domain-containing protein [Pelagophyceae sp. CCMP2097]|nr:SPOC like C-terminal domain-containing protein [Pelagophyceae sp. CCMP2097]